MISKCANPACNERFLYLHLGKVFHLCPTPEVDEAEGEFSPALCERFWLCDRCCKQMTLVWGGTKARLVPLPTEPVTNPSAIPAKADTRQRSRKRAAHAGFEWR